MISIDDPRIAEFITLWHENGRASFERSYANLDYDCEHYRKAAKEARRYIHLNDGTSGRFLLDRNTGEVWGIKAYGVRHPGKFAGTLDQLIASYREANEQKRRLSSRQPAGNPGPNAGESER